MFRTHASKVILPICAALIVLALACSSEEEPTPTPASVPQPTAAPLSIKQYSSAPEMVIDTSKKYTATIEMEKGGNIVIELFAKEVPNTVNNFVFLAREGYYDGVTFHRVIPGFMAQGGDPTGTGSGGPGYQFDNEFHADARHDSPGIISMANSGLRSGRGTNGSQFFITYVPTLNLDGLNPDGSPKSCGTPGVSCHAVFGKVIEGMEVVEGISPRDPASASAPGDAIKTITIEENESSTSAQGEEPTPTPTSVPQATAAPVTNKQYSSAPAMVIDTSKKYTATIEMEKGGDIVIELLAKEVPITVNNFVFLAREGYYDGITFHRVIPDFMAQTGDPTGTGSGGPGYQFDNEFHEDARHDSPGTVSMANSGVRNGRGTNGSQFFITYVDTSFLDGLNPNGNSKNCFTPGVSCHAVFGKVIEGMEVV